jgi:hypothetical protein
MCSGPSRSTCILYRRSCAGDELILSVHGLILSRVQRRVMNAIEHCIAHQRKPQFTRLRAGSHTIDRGRWHPAFGRIEVMFHHESVIKVELVAERKLAPQLLVALKGRSFRVCSKSTRSAQTSWFVYPRNGVTDTYASSNLTLSKPSLEN